MYAPGDAVTATSFGASEPSTASVARSVRDRRRRHPGRGVRPIGQARRIRRRVLRPILPADTPGYVAHRDRVRRAARRGGAARRSLRSRYRRDRHRVGRGSGSEARVRVRRPARRVDAGRGGTRSSRRSTSRRRGWTSRATRSSRSAWFRCGAVAWCSPTPSISWCDPEVPPSVAVAEDPRAPSAGSRRRSTARTGRRRAPRCDPRPLPAGVVRRRRGELPVGDLRQERRDRGAAARSTSGTWRSRRTGHRPRRARSFGLRADVGRPGGWASRSRTRTTRSTTRSSRRRRSSSSPPGCPAGPEPDGGGPVSPCRRALGPG